MFDCVFVDKIVKKRACTTPGCGPVCTGDHCLNHPQTWTFEVACWKTGYMTDGWMKSSTIYLSTYDNDPPSASLKCELCCKILY